MDEEIPESQENHEGSIKSKSQDAAAARREARRKRILENSNNRLEKITGRPHTEEIRDSFADIPIVNQIYDDPDFEREVYERPTRDFNNFPPQTEGISQLLNTLRQDQMGGGGFRNGGTPFMMRSPQHSTTATPPPPPSTLSKFLGTKIHIVLIAIIVYILFATGNQHLSYNSVFLYLLLWEIAEVFLLKTYTHSTNNILQIVFLFGGISPNVSHAVMKIFGTFNKILKDVAIFLFFFVLSHLMYETIGNGKSLHDILNREEFLDTIQL